MMGWTDRTERHDCQCEFCKTHICIVNSGGTRCLHKDCENNNPPKPKRIVCNCNGIDGSLVFKVNFKCTCGEEIKEEMIDTDDDSVVCDNCNRNYTFVTNLVAIEVIK